MSRSCTLYSRLGGYNAMESIAKSLFTRIKSDYVLGQYWSNMSADAINKNKDLLLGYLCSSAGGPEQYSGRDNKTAHKGMGINEQDWTIFMAYVVDELEKHKIAKQERDEVLNLLASTKDDIVEIKQSSDSERSLFEKIGSLAKVQELASEFYDAMDKEPFAKELRDIHPKNLFMSKKSLAKFISQWLGGPKLFGEQYVNVTWLELRHRRFELSESNKQQWLYCMNIAMCNVGIEDDLKHELNRKFLGMINSMQIQRNKNKN